jgi:ABC-type Fe3+-citrate transport system substrate-binding protein
VAGSYMTEVVFFHHASRTLVLADLIENFEPHKLGSFALRWLMKLGGVAAPDGQTPRDLRATFARQRPAMKAAVERMIAWNPERVIIAHGRWFETEGAAELRRSFRWLLD